VCPVSGLEEEERLLRSIEAGQASVETHHLGGVMLTFRIVMKSMLPIPAISRMHPGPGPEDSNLNYDE